MGEKENFTARPAGFWIRAGAAFLDGVVINLGLLPVVMVIGLLSAMKALPEGPMAGLLTLPFVIGIPIAYVVIMTAKKGQTLGKMLLGIQVIPDKGNKISMGLSAGRYFASMLSFITLCVGYIMAGVRNDKRALHDVIAGTQVKRIKAIPILGIILLCLLPFTVVSMGGVLAAIAIPKFAGNLEKAREGATKANVSNLRNAIAMYQMENNSWPKTLDVLVGKYIDEMPKIKLKGMNSDRIEYYSFSSKGMMDPGKLKFTGGWAYDPSSGNVALDIEGKDSRGKEFWMYGYE